MNAATDSGTSPQTAVRDAILAGVSARLDDDAVRGLEDVSISATEAACLSRDELLDWSEYRAVAL
jgi:hypothetical protein